MDSDDDFNSSMSGDDFDDQDSDLGLEEGAHSLDLQL
jgi:ariadne-1